MTRLFASIAGALALVLVTSGILPSSLVVAEQANNDDSQVCQNTAEGIQNDGSCRARQSNTKKTAGRSASSSATTNKPVPTDCRVVMAPSTIPNAGWGVFSLVNLQRGMPLLAGDVVIQVTDLNQADDGTMTLLQDEYLWESSETGGFYEGKRVASVLPGVGSLANGRSNSKQNVLPFVPTIDEAGLTRLDSPGAGAVTHYHNLTFFASKDMQSGSEIFCDYSGDWFQERRGKVLLPEVEPVPHATEWLRQHGRCLDNVKPGVSRLQHAGRGAFATRDLDEGDVVVPVPVLVIPKREVLDLSRQRQNGTTVQTKQLLLNYCLGHINSSILMYPYGPMVNLVNHAPSKKANVRLQWSESNELHRQGKEWIEQPVSNVKSYNRSGLLLELVATKDIDQGEEILLDYGLDWQRAWDEHVRQWEPVQGAAKYTPSYVMEDVVKTLRTEPELADYPYPDDVLTSCFYRYSDDKTQAERNTDSDAVTTFHWTMNRGLFEMRNLRPCQILQRENDPKQGTHFTVRILNRYGLSANERLPRGAVHIVTQVPRRAVRFSDKLYSTDQHLENAFRHEIGIPNDVFPSQWKDLV